MVAIAHLRQAQGFDLQVVGFGKSEVYHGDNEYTLLSDMRDAMIILSQVGTAVCCGALLPGASSPAPMFTLSVSQRDRYRLVLFQLFPCSHLGCCVWRSVCLSTKPGRV